MRMIHSRKVFHPLALSNPPTSIFSFKFNPFSFRTIKHQQQPSSFLHNQLNFRIHLAFHLRVKSREKCGDDNIIRDYIQMDRSTKQLHRYICALKNSPWTIIKITYFEEKDCDFLHNVKWMKNPFKEIAFSWFCHIVAISWKVLRVCCATRENRKSRLNWNGCHKFVETVE